MPTRLPHPVFCLAFALIVCRSSPAEEPKSLPPMPDVVRFTFASGDRLPPDLRPNPDYPDYWGGRVLGYGCAPILDTTNPVDRSASIALSRHGEFLSACNHLQVGDIIPVVRAIYRVESLTPGIAEEFSTAAVVCRRIDTPIDGVKVTPDAYAFAFDPKRKEDDEPRVPDIPHMRMQSISFYVQFIPEKGDEPMAVKVVVLDPHVKGETRTLPSGKTVTLSPTYIVRVGDLLKIGHESRRVVNIVPPDPKKHVTGWFEINIKPEPVSPETK